MVIIANLIENIRKARLGKDVRESIAQAIEQTYEDASKDGNANMEVSEARGTYATLKKRLDNSDSVKADKTTTANLQTQINELASGSPLVASSTSEMTDTTKVYVNTNDGYWYYYNGADWVQGDVYQATEDSETVNGLVNEVNEIEELFEHEKIVKNLGNVIIRSSNSNNTIGTLKGIAIVVFTDNPITHIKINTKASNNDNLICVILSEDGSIEYARDSQTITTDYSTITFNFNNSHSGVVQLRFFTENNNELAYAAYGISYISNLLYFDEENKNFWWTSADGTTYNRYDNSELKQGISCEIITTEKKLYSVVESVEKCLPENEFKMNYIYVSKQGSDSTGDGSENNSFATIYHANEVINDNSKSNRYTIIVGPGIYTDLQERYAGIDGSYYQGIICKDYVYYESNDILNPENCVLKWDGAVGYNLPVSDANCVNKCIFHIKDNVNTHIKGFTINSKNTRYCMHIETVGATIPNKWLIENCIFEWDGRPNSEDNGSVARACVGTGYTFGEKGTFKNCHFKMTNPAPLNHLIFQTHDNIYNPSMSLKTGENVKFENCLISLADGSNYAHFDLRSNSTTPDVPSFLKLKNVYGKPIYITNNGNVPYKVIFEGTDQQN